MWLIDKWVSKNTRQAALFAFLGKYYFISFDEVQHTLFVHMHLSSYT